MSVASRSAPSARRDIRTSRFTADDDDEDASKRDDSEDDADDKDADSDDDSDDGSRDPKRPAASWSVEEQDSGTTL